MKLRRTLQHLVHAPYGALHLRHGHAGAQLLLQLNQALRLRLLGARRLHRAGERGRPRQPGPKAPPRPDWVRTWRWDSPRSGTACAHASAHSATATTRSDIATESELDRVGDL